MGFGSFFVPTNGVFPVHVSGRSRKCECGVTSFGRSLILKITVGVKSLILLSSCPITRMDLVTNHKGVSLVSTKYILKASMIFLSVGGPFVGISGCLSSISGGILTKYCFSDGDGLYLQISRSDSATRWLFWLRFLVVADWVSSVSSVSSFYSSLVETHHLKVNLLQLALQRTFRIVSSSKSRNSGWDFWHQKSSFNCIYKPLSQFSGVSGRTSVVSMQGYVLNGRLYGNFQQSGGFYGFYTHMVTISGDSFVDEGFFL